MPNIACGLGVIARGHLLSDVSLRSPHTIVWMGEPKADRDLDKAVTVADLLIFLTDFTAGDMCADMNGDGGVDIDDLLLFLDAFEQGII